MPKQKPTLNQSDIHLLKKTFAIKKDLDAFATKKDLDQRLRKQSQDLDKKLQDLRDEIETLLLDHLQKNYVTKTELQELRDKIELLPTKEEFFAKMDEVIGHYKAFQEERDAILQEYQRIKQHFNIQ